MGYWEKTRQQELNDIVSEALIGLKEAHEYGGKSRELLLKLLQFEGKRIDALENKIDTCPHFIPISQTYYEIEENRVVGELGELPIDINIDTANSDSNLTMNFSIFGNTENVFAIFPSVVNSIDNSHIQFSLKDDTIFLNYEGVPEYNLTIRADNTPYWYNDSPPPNCYDEININIKVINLLDNAPVIVFNQDLSDINESIAQGDVLGVIETNGTNSDENNITCDTEPCYIIEYVGRKTSAADSDYEPYDKNIIRIENNGTVVTNRTFLDDFIESQIPDLKTYFKIQVSAYNTWYNDTNHTSNVETFYLKVSNVIDNEPVLSLQTSVPTFEENSSTPLDTVLFTVDTNGTIYDENNVTSFNIVEEVSGYSSKFEINSTSGEVTLKDLLNFEDNIIDTDPHDGKKTYKLRINATNKWWDGSEHNSSDVYYQIDITNVIEQPPKINIYSFNEGDYISNLNNQVTIPEAMQESEIFAAVETESETTLK